MTQQKPKRIRKPKVNAKHRDAQRPTLYHEYWAQRICSHIERGWSLRGFCEKDGNPRMPTVLKWLKESPDFQAQYAHAREASADADADHIGNLAEKAAHGLIDPQAARVAIDARKWLAGKRKPKKYGERLELGGAGADGAILVRFDASDEKLM